MEGQIREILAEEGEEKALRIAEMEANKVRPGTPRPLPPLATGLDVLQDCSVALVHQSLASPTSLPSGFKHDRLSCRDYGASG